MPEIVRESLSFASENMSNYNGDPLFLHNSDHPGMNLVSTHLNGSNYLSWNRAMKIALAAKVKLGFINGTVSKPTSNPVLIDQWTRCDNMVICWILNAIATPLAEAFLYARSSYELWQEVSERFGQSNGPLLFQLEKDVNDTSQNNDYVAVYYTKLKKLWDEMRCISEIPCCTCGKCTCNVTKKVLDLEQSRHLMKFLMGMNEDYDNARGQILLMDPLPSINKAYSMLTQVEKQKQVITNVHNTNDMAAYNVTRPNLQSCTYCHKNGHSEEKCYKKHGYPSSSSNNHLGGKNDSKRLKTDKFCQYCHKSGHFEHNCYKKNGYPPSNNNPRSQNSARLANNAYTDNMEHQESPLDDNLYHTKCESIKSSSEGDNKALIAAVMQEVMKIIPIMQSKQAGNTDHSVNFAGPYN